MMHTEEEAKKNWCPFSRVAITLGGGTSVKMLATNANRSEVGDAFKHSKCMAAGCMAWRWGEWQTTRRRRTENEPFTYYDEEAKPVRGYCGLAGRPHD